MKPSDIIPIQIIKLLRKTFKKRWKRTLKFNCENAESIEVTIGTISVCDVFGDDAYLKIIYTEEARDSDGTTEHEFVYYYADPNNFDIDKIVDKIYSLYKREIDVHKYDIPDLIREQAREQARMVKLKLQDL